MSSKKLKTQQYLPRIMLLWVAVRDCCISLYRYFVVFFFFKRASLLMLLFLLFSSFFCDCCFVFTLLLYLLSNTFRLREILYTSQLSYGQWNDLCWIMSVYATLTVVFFLLLFFLFWLCELLLLLLRLSFLYVLFYTLKNECKWNTLTVFLDLLFDLFVLVCMLNVMQPSIF